MLPEDAPRLGFSDRVGREKYAELEGLQHEKLQKLVARAWELQKGPAKVKLEIVWMGEAEHSRLHERFLNDPTPTDVITFPYEDDDLFGEIIVNLDMALEQATSRKIDMCDEVALYVVHGALHLLGLEDATDAQRVVMRAAEAAVMMS
ncbi:MAG: rRNA maturation RNase YbeY [Planctomycetota bacterium]|nr:MAG: rRNA maturation RNase YbeY [Planctomycetota bacterium]